MASPIRIIDPRDHIGTRSRSCWLVTASTSVFRRMSTAGPASLANSSMRRSFQRSGDAASSVLGISAALGGLANHQTSPARPMHGTAAQGSATLDPAKGWERAFASRAPSMPSAIATCAARRTERERSARVSGSESVEITLAAWRLRSPAPAAPRRCGLGGTDTAETEDEAVRAAATDEVLGERRELDAVARCRVADDQIRAW